ncbi:MAG: DUF4139 domain-containing protein [Bacteroidetes bacterium]|nr:DUF4139 domain-containing protein [Bacteroidota bacterium]
MKIIIRFMLATLLLPCLAKAQDPVWVGNSEIKEVKIFQNGAMVTRTAKATLNPGLQEVVLDGLSPYINPQSISLKGTGDATILAVSFQQNYLVEKKKSKEITSLEQDLDSLSLRLQQVKNKIVVLSETQALLQANKSIGGANNGVLVDEPTMSSFDFSYVINSNVTWYAFYDIKVKDVNSPVELVYKAKVNQSSGEDWNQVRLSLSTGNPAVGSERPFLNPWYLNFYQPRQMYSLQDKANRMDMPSAPAVAEGAVMSKAEDQQDMKNVSVIMSENQLSSSFEIQQPYSIPSDGQDYQVEIQKHSLKADYNYIVLPKLDADAFLTARITGWEELSLTAGGANIYFDGAYVGESFVNPAETNDTLEISLGRDKRIVVKREKLKDLSGSKLFGGNKERSLSYDISIKNGKKEAISILLYDQIPLTMQKDIEVKVEELSGGEHNVETGEVKWKLQIPAGETTKKRLSLR